MEKTRSQSQTMHWIECWMSQSNYEKIWPPIEITMVQRFFRSFQISYCDRWKSTQIKTEHCRFIEFTAGFNGTVQMIRVQHYYKKVTANPWQSWQP